MDKLYKTSSPDNRKSPAKRSRKQAQPTSSPQNSPRNTNRRVTRSNRRIADDSEDDNSSSSQESEDDTDFSNPIQENYRRQNNSRKEYDSKNTSWSAKRPEPIRKEDPKSNSRSLLALTGIIVTMIAFLLFQLKGSGGSEAVQNRLSLEDKINDYSQKYPKQEQFTWDQLLEGISSVPKFNEPSVFMLTYWSSSPSANPGLDIAQTVGRLSSAYLGNKTEESKGNPVQVSYEDLNSLTDHRELIDKYKEDIIRSHAMIITELDKVRGKVAQGLRYFCDEYAPSSPHSVVFSTVNMKNCGFASKEEFKNASYKEVIIGVEKCLKDFWNKDLASSVYRPVIIRVVNRVLKIYDN